jgi:hypothetical protein
MSVFRNYNGQQAGGVNANAFPKVYSHPWQPTQRNVRANPNIPSQPQRIQPQERGANFPTSASGGGTLAPQMSSGCAGCGGCNSNGTSQVDVPTASDVSTSHAFPTTGDLRRPPTSPRLQGRMTGAMRPGLKTGSTTGPRLSLLGGRMG